MNTALTMTSALVKCVNPELDIKEATIGIKQRIDLESLLTSIEISNLIWLRKIVFVNEEILFLQQCLKAILLLKNRLNSTSNACIPSTENIIMSYI